VPDPPPESPPESLPDAFRAVARRMREAAREALAPWDVTPAQARALGTLLRTGPLRLGDLAEALRIAPRSATEVVDALESRGLVRRAPDPADRRATLVGPTAHGAEVGTAIRAARAAEAESVFRDLPDTDRAHLARILHTLTRP